MERVLFFCDLARPADESSHLTAARGALRVTLPTQEAMSDVEAIVGDVGSSWTRIGMAGESSPKAWFPSVLGKVGGTGKSKKWAASLDELHRHKGVPLHHPVREGVVEDWDGVEFRRTKGNSYRAEVHGKVWPGA